MRNGALMFKSDLFRKARRRFASLAFASICSPKNTQKKIRLICNR